MIRVLWSGGVVVMNISFLGMCRWCLFFFFFFFFIFIFFIFFRSFTSFHFWTNIHTHTHIHIPKCMNGIRYSKLCTSNILYFYRFAVRLMGPRLFLFSWICACICCMWFFTLCFFNLYIQCFLFFFILLLLSLSLRRCMCVCCVLFAKTHSHWIKSSSTIAAWRCEQLRFAYVYHSI